MKRLGWTAGVLVLGAAGLLAAATRLPAEHRRGVVVSSHALASQAGLDVLRKGGNAVDAAVAVTLAVGVTDPQSAGIGGGGFALWFNAKDRTVKALDFRERAPLGATRDMYVDETGHPSSRMSTQGHLAVAVPGTVAGLWALHQAGGKQAWKDLVEPAIQLAQDGVLVSRHLHQSMVEEVELLRRNPEAADVFLKRGEPYAQGDLLLQRDLADTLRAIQQDGAKAFYDGDIAHAVAEEMEERGGLITLEDLQAYEPIWRQALTGTYRHHTVATFPPPSSGGVHLLQMLGFVEMQSPKPLPPGSAASSHVLIEAMRRAYADRAQWLGDPAFVDVPVTGLLNPAYLRQRWQDFSQQHASPADLGPGDPWAFQPGLRPAPAPPPDASQGMHTAHLVVVDAERNAVSLTFTVNTRLGSGVVVPGTGILLNNEMDDFSAQPGSPNAYGLVGGEANAIAPAKIPLSSMTPTLVFEGDVPVRLSAPDVRPPVVALAPDHRLRLALGAPGGSTIITTVLQVLLGVVDQGLDVEAAVSLVRIHHQWKPAVVRVEQEGLPQDVVRGLFARGHVLQVGGHWGNATAVEVVGDQLRGAADPRGDGNAAGY